MEISFPGDREEERPALLWIVFWAFSSYWNSPGIGGSWGETLRILDGVSTQGDGGSGSSVSTSAAEVSLSSTVRPGRGNGTATGGRGAVCSGRALPIGVSIFRNNLSAVEPLRNLSVLTCGSDGGAASACSLVVIENGTGLSPSFIESTSSSVA